MNAYENDIRAMENPGMAEIIRIAKGYVSPMYRHSPWTHPEVKHGKGILASEEGLNCYLSAYGTMHAHKMRHALQNCDLCGLEGGFEVVDWGCGQGLASVCLLEHLLEQGLPLPARIMLVDISAAALDRAELHLGVLAQGRVELRRMERSMPGYVSGEWQGDTLAASQPTVLHLLSNIFDLPGVSVSKLGEAIAAGEHSNIVVCAAHYEMAPYIEIFSSKFSLAPKSAVFKEGKKPWGRLPNGHSYGAALKVFRTTGKGEKQEEAGGQAAPLLLAA